MKLIDLTGQKFGRYTVEGRVPAGDRSPKHTYWQVRCECGKTSETTSNNLRRGHSTSCSCYAADVNRAKRITKGMVGRTFGWLTVKEEAPNPYGNPQQFWKCECKCGENTVVCGNKLRSGHTTSCGCKWGNHQLDSVYGFTELDPDRGLSPALIYIAEVGHYTDKIGITTEPKTRAKQGHYTAWLFTKKMTRAECWAVEQVALKMTKALTPETPYLGAGYSGPTEQRIGWDRNAAIEALSDLCADCQAMGWQEFYNHHFSN